jgi:TolB-like protein/class 3 adenylate cyclase
LATQRIERRLAAILAADIAGYSRLMEADEEDTLARLKTHRRELIDPKISEHRGRIVKTTGDGLLIEFPSVIEAVSCAVAVQRGMAERNAETPKEERITFRIGVNLGDVIVEDGDIHGDGVNIAARLEGIAEHGGICISEDAFRQMRGKVDAEFDDIGEQKLRNITRSIRVYRVGPTSTNPNPPPRAGEGSACSARVGAAELPPLPLPEKPSLAVLPFQNLSGDPEQEYFADGVVEEITTAISRLPWLFVIARNSSFAFKGRAVDVHLVARELGVRYVLEGSVRKAGNRVRITGQLIDTATGAHIWADRFDGALDHIFELQDQVASSVVGAIEPKLRQSEIERSARKPTGSLDAYDLYLRALAEFHKFTADGMRQSVALLRRALAIDPSYAPAAALIGFCRHFQRDHGLGGPVSDADVVDSVRLARHAITAGRDDPDALWMAAIVLMVFADEHAAAATLIDRALMLNPNSAHAWMHSGLLSCFRNQPGPAIEALRHAMRLSPLDPLSPGFKSALALAHLVAGRYEEALQWADRALHEHPEFDPAMGVKVALLARLGRIDEAREWLKRRLELQPGLTIAEWKARGGAVKFASPELLAMYEDGLRKAGLPEA